MDGTVLEEGCLLLLRFLCLLSVRHQARILLLQLLLSDMCVVVGRETGRQKHNNIITKRKNEESNPSCGILNEASDGDEKY